MRPCADSSNASAPRSPSNAIRTGRRTSRGSSKPRFRGRAQDQRRDEGSAFGFARSRPADHAFGARQIDALRPWQRRDQESDVATIVADASALHLDAAVNGAFSGDYAAVSDTAAKVFAEGTDANTLLAAALWHALLLHKIKLETERGTSSTWPLSATREPIGFCAPGGHQ